MSPVRAETKGLVSDLMGTVRGWGVGSSLFLARTIGQIVLSEKANLRRGADLDILDLRLAGN